MWREKNSLLKGRSFHQIGHQISALKGWSNWKREKMNTKAQSDDKQQKNIRKTTQRVSGAINQTSGICRSSVRDSFKWEFILFQEKGTEIKYRAQTVEERRQKGNGMQERCINKFNE